MLLLYAENKVKTRKRYHMNLIEQVYTLLVYFREQEAKGLDVSNEISGLQACLKFLQKKEGNKIQKQTDERLKTIEHGLKILEQAEELIKKYS